MMSTHRYIVIFLIVFLSIAVAVKAQPAVFTQIEDFDGFAIDGSVTTNILSRYESTFCKRQVFLEKSRPIILESFF